MSQFSFIFYRRSVQSTPPGPNRKLWSGFIHTRVVVLDTGSTLVKLSSIFPIPRARRGLLGACQASSGLVGSSPGIVGACWGFVGAGRGLLGARQGSSGLVGGRGSAGILDTPTIFAGHFMLTVQIFLHDICRSLHAVPHAPSTHPSHTDANTTTNATNTT